METCIGWRSALYLWVSLWKQSPFTPVECQDSPRSLVYIQQVVAAISDPTQPASRGAGISGGGLTMSPDTERRHTHTTHNTAFWPLYYYTTTQRLSTYSPLSSHQTFQPTSHNGFLYNLPGEKYLRKERFRAK